MPGATSNRRDLLWLTLGTVTMAIVMAVLMLFELAQRQEVKNSIALRTDSITAPAFECEREFLLLQQTLERMLHRATPPDSDALTLRYDLFLSRLTLLRDSPSIEVLKDRTEYQTVIPKLERWAHHAEPLMVNAAHNPKVLAGLLAEVSALGPEVHALSLAANSEVTHLLEQQAHTMLSQTGQILGLTLVQMTLLLVAAFALFMRQKRQENERLALEKITEDLRAANLLAQTSMEKLHRSQDDLARAETKAALSTVIASVSHELSTPLGNSLMMASSLVDQGRAFQRSVDANDLKRSELNAFVASMRKGHDLMVRNLHRAAELLRSFKQVANDQASEQRRTFDLATVVREIVDTLAPSLKRHPHRIVIDIPDGITMNSRPGPLGQVIINLVNNAYMHAFDGRHNGVVTITGTAADGRIQLSVADNGIGMSKTTLTRIFQPFFSTKINQGGTGLGMSIVANLITQTLGGTITVDSTEGLGTTWHVDLPQVKE